MLHGEAFVVDSGEEVAVFELLLDGFDGFFFPCARDCGGDGREETVGFENGFGGGVEWVHGSGYELAGLGFGGRKRKTKESCGGFHGDWKN